MYEVIVILRDVNDEDPNKFNQFGSVVEKHDDAFEALANAENAASNAILAYTTG